MLSLLVGVAALLGGGALAPELMRGRLGRREALFGGLVALGAAPLPVHAQRSKLISRSSAEGAQAAKEFKYSKPGEESAEFKANEAKRQTQPTPMSLEDDLKRIGVRTYADAVKAGVDVCDTSKTIGCGRRGR